jgi:DNA polymerase-1
MNAASKSSDTLYLIDGSGFIFRAFHALPDLTRPDGTHIGAVLGFCNMLHKLLDDLKAEHIGVIFDAHSAICLDPRRYARLRHSRY